MVWCWDLLTGKEVWRTELPVPAHHSSLSADGTTLAMGGQDGTVTVRDAATGKRRAEFRPGAIGHAARLKVSPDGKVVATTPVGSDCVSVAFWDAATGKLLTGHLPGHPSEVSAAGFDPRRGTAYTLGRDRTFRTWDPATGRELARSAAAPADHLAASPDAAAPFAAGPGGSVRALDPRTGKTVRQFPAFAGELVGLAVTADGKRLVAGGPDADEEGRFAVRFLDARTGESVGGFTGSGGKLEQLAVRPDGGAVITSHLGRKVVVWSADGKRLAEHAGRGRRTSAWVKGNPPYAIGSVAASPDGR